jgi:hypothetical protein
MEERMSHFLVAVIGGDHEGQLEPFWEELECEPHEEECYNCCGNPPDEGEDPCDECEGSGTIMSTSNPDARWDWYSVGGRWKGTLKLNKKAIEEGGYGDAEYVDEAEIKDIDWTGMIDKVKAERRQVWDHMQNVFAGKEEPDTFDGFNGITRETGYDEYINKNWGIAPYSILHEGEWIEKGSMGWFGQSDDKVDDDEWDREFMKAIKNMDPETYITMVDCHT